MIKFSSIKSALGNARWNKIIISCTLNILTTNIAVPEAAYTTPFCLAVLCIEPQRDLTIIWP